MSFVHIQLPQKYFHVSHVARRFVFKCALLYSCDHSTVAPAGSGCTFARSHLSLDMAQSSKLKVASSKFAA